MDDIYIQKILAGDSELFRHFISKYKDMAYSIAMSVLKDEFYAEEVLQISFLRAFENLSAFKGRSKFSTWLYRIVINQAFKLDRKHKNEFITFVEAPPDDVVEIDNSILKLEVEDQRHIINEALQKLAPRECLVLRLFYLEENSIDEIRDMTGWTDSNIKVILHRARINLKSVLTKFYKFDKRELN